MMDEERLSLGGITVDEASILFSGIIVTDGGSFPVAIDSWLFIDNPAG